MSAAENTTGRAINFPKVARGHKRQWVRCRTCSEVAYYEYVPYSLSTPIMSMACGHGITQRDMGCDCIDEKTARAALASTKAVQS